MTHIIIFVDQVRTPRRVKTKLPWQGDT